MTPHTTADFMATVLSWMLIWWMCGTNTSEYSYLVMVWAVSQTVPEEIKGLTGDF